MVEDCNEESLSDVSISLDVDVDDDNNNCSDENVDREIPENSDTNNIIFCSQSMASSSESDVKLTEGNRQDDDGDNDDSEDKRLVNSSQGSAKKYAQKSELNTETILTAETSSSCSKDTKMAAVDDDIHLGVQDNFAHNNNNNNDGNIASSKSCINAKHSSSSVTDTNNVNIVEVIDILSDSDDEKEENRDVKQFSSQNRKGKKFDDERTKHRHNNVSTEIITCLSHNSDSDSDIEVIGTCTSTARHTPQAQAQPSAQSNYTAAQYNVSTHPQYSSYQHQYAARSKGTAHQTQHQYNTNTNTNNYHLSSPQQKQQQQHKFVIEMENYKLSFHTKVWFKLSTEYTPTWGKIFPPRPTPTHNEELNGNQIRAYKLSLYSQNEFVVTAVHHPTNDWNFVPTLKGLRKIIKEITKHYGNGQKAIFEPGSTKEESDQNEQILNSGRWRIPLGAYNSFLAYLTNHHMFAVEPIPDRQLKIASMGRAMSERGYPSVETVQQWGVPSGLANSLAPYQRGGVDFVLQKDGRALVADDMGLGKTIQGIASMCCYQEDWPLLVLCPSSARYHWEAELLNWLGEDSAINKQDSAINNENVKRDLESSHDHNGTSRGRKRKLESSQDSSEEKTSSNEKQILLRPNEINVITSSKDVLLRKDARVVIVSYGLVTNLISKELIVPGMFNCVIVDESHMLKNKKSKRTKLLLPVLYKARRVIMLSGTPALAKPTELYPQLFILGAHKGWWHDEQEFLDKYGKKEDADANFAELHTLLKSTVMIRRMKSDMLKNLPGKIRESVCVHPRCPELKRSIMGYMRQLKEGRGVLGKLAKNQHNETFVPEEKKDGDFMSRDNDCSRKAVLNNLFSITGNSKIPIVVDMLKQFIADPKNGKLLIFAHHVNVLNSIINLAGLSNLGGSKTSYIRIDGSTGPKLRQEQITRFQTDPSVRVAILGITAAGVAVTLTAASTIWFAELFWTPALLIQAEDRCHRIGQQSQIRCLYIIAKDTLDEVLFLLIQKKFRDLGEFVEGKEKMNLVISRTYHSENDAVKSLCVTSTDEKDFENGEVVDDVFESLANEAVFQKDVLKLAMEEEAEMKIEDDDEYVDEDISSRKEVVLLDPVVSNENNANKSGDPAIGASRQEAICLSDDEDDPGPLSTKELYQGYLKNPVHFTQVDIPPTTQMPNLKGYYMYFTGPIYGFHVTSFCGRIVISEASEATVSNQIVPGDFICGVNEVVLPFPHLNHNLMLGAMKDAPVRLAIGRDDDFTMFFKKFLERGPLLKDP